MTEADDCAVLSSRGDVAQAPHHGRSTIGREDGIGRCVTRDGLGQILRVDCAAFGDLVVLRLRDIGLAMMFKTFVEKRVILVLR